MARQNIGHFKPGWPIDPIELMRVFESYRTYLKAEARLRRGRLLKVREATSDLVQWTALAAVERLRNGEGPEGGDEEALRAWLRLILRREVERLRKRLRAKARDPRKERPVPEGLAGNSSSPQDRAERRESGRRVTEALTRIDPKDCDILLERVVDDMTFRALGERRGISAPGAFQAYQAALDRFRTEVGEN